MVPSLQSLMPFQKTPPVQPDKDTSNSALPVEPLQENANVNILISENLSQPLEKEKASPTLSRKKITRSKSTPAVESTVQKSSNKTNQFHPVCSDPQTIKPRGSSFTKTTNLKRHSKKTAKTLRPTDVQIESLPKEKTFFELRDAILCNRLEEMDNLKAGQFNYFNAGLSLTRDLENIKPMIQKEFSDKSSVTYDSIYHFVQKNENYKIYLVMLAYLDKISSYSSENLLERIHAIDLEKSLEDSHSPKKEQKNNWEIDFKKEIFKTCRNLIEIKDLKILIKEIYLESLLQKALKELEHILMMLPPGESVDYSLPEHVFLKNINKNISNLHFVSSKLQKSTSYGPILCPNGYPSILHRFANKTSKLQDGNIISKSSFNTSAIRCFLNFFESEILKMEIALYREKHKIHSQLEHLNASLKNHENPQNQFWHVLPKLDLEINKEEIGETPSLNEYDAHTVRLARQIFSYEETKKIIKRDRSLKPHYDSINDKLSRSYESSTEDESSRSPSPVVDEKKMLRRKSVSKIPGRKTLVQSNSPRKGSKGSLDKNSDAHSTSSSVSPREPFNAEEFLKKVILNPEIGLQIKTKILNVFDYFILGNTKEPTQTFFEIILKNLTETQLYVKDQILSLIECWLHNPFLNLKNSSFNNIKTRHQIQLILNNIDSNGQIFKSHIENLYKLLNQPHPEPTKFICCSTADPIDMAINKKFTEAFPSYDSCVDSFVKACSMMSIRKFTKLNSLHWKLKYGKIVMNENNPMEEYSQTLHSWALNLFSAYSSDQKINLFNFFWDVIKQLTFKKDKSSSLPMDLASAEALYSALKIVSKFYLIKPPEFPKKEVYLKNILKGIKENKQKTFIPTLFSLKTFSNIVISGNENLLKIEEISNHFEAWFHTQKYLSIYEQADLKELNLKNLINLQSYLDDLKSNKRYIEHINTTKKHKDNYVLDKSVVVKPHEIKIDTSKIFDSFKLEHYIESLLKGDLKYKCKLLSIFKIFCNPLLFKHEFHTEFFLQILLDKYKYADDQGKIGILQIVISLLSSSFHFSKDEDLFNREKLLICPIIKKIIKFSEMSTNDELLNRAKYLDNYLEKQFVLKKFAPNPNLLGSPLALIKLIALGKKGKRGDQDYDDVVRDLATTFKQMSLMKILKINSSELVLPTFGEENAPNIFALNEHYSKMRLWVINLILDCQNKTEINHLFEFFLDVIEISLMESTVSNPVDFGSIVMIVFALDFCRALWFPISLKYENKFEKYNFIYGKSKTQDLRKICDGCEFKIPFINIVTKDLAGLFANTENSLKPTDLSMEDCIPLKILSSLFSAMEKVTYKAEIKTYHILFDNDVDKADAVCYEKLKKLSQILSTLRNSEEAS